MDISGLNSSYMQYVAGNTSADRMENKVNGDYSKSTDDELMAVCKEFETYFLEQVFKQMVKTIPESETGSGSNKALVDYYKDSMVQSLAAESTEQNSLGLAQTMYEQMKRNMGTEIPKVDET